MKSTEEAKGLFWLLICNAWLGSCSASDGDRTSVSHVITHSILCGIFSCVKNYLLISSLSLSSSLFLLSPPATNHYHHHWHHKTAKNKRSEEKTKPATQFSKNFFPLMMEMKGREKIYIFIEKDCKIDRLSKQSCIFVLVRSGQK